MKILLCHNSYRYRGGEDQVFEDERDLLRAAGHDVITYQRHNREIENVSRVKAAVDTVWNRRTYRELKQLIQQERPAIAHFHNIFPIISPSAYYAARDQGIPVVQTLHNFRLLCPGSALLRDGKVCEDCVGKAFAVGSVKHGCYKRSKAASLVTATMLATHWRMRTWSTAVTRFIALTPFARDKFISGGVPAERIRLKPNCVQPDPGFGTNDGQFAVFVGRLSEEKGVAKLLEAWQTLGRQMPLKIAGEGPLEHLVNQAQADGHNVESLGMLPHTEVLELIGRARILICPSICHEGFGRSVIEAFAGGAAVVASDIEPMDHLIQDGVTGLLFQSGNVDDLAEKVRLLAGDDGLWRDMRNAARAQYEANYTPQGNYDQLVAIYHEAMEGYGQYQSGLANHGNQRKAVQEAAS